MRITGTHIYGMLRCTHAVTLDLTEDRSKRRPITEIEEFVRQRGRDFEAEFVAGLEGYVEPEFERGAFDVGAAQTEAFLRGGVVGVSQGVLQGENRLGIPDLLRKEPGASDFGDYHYVVGDIKTSGRPRSDQLLQVAFYSRMLGDLQGRAPDYAYLILKDGREERFALREFDAAIEEVEERVFALASDPATSEPFYSRACSKCHWSELCVPRMREASDLSLVQGMTRGLRTTLHRIGVEDVTALRGVAVESAGRRTHLEPALLRRLKKSAEAHLSGRPVRQRQSKQASLGEVAVVHHLYDAFSERMLFFGVRFLESAGPVSHSVYPDEREHERGEFLAMLNHVPDRMPLLHYRETLPRWFAESGPMEHRTGIESRFVDLARRLRGAAIYPGPVFGLSSHVEYALGLDPHRAGNEDGAALFGAVERGPEWLKKKGHADLEDLFNLVDYVRAVECRAAGAGREGEAPEQVGQEGSS